MDLIIRNGTIVTSGDITQADVGIEGGKVKQISQGLGPAAREIDAMGKYVFPGGVDVHTHVDFELLGNKSVDDFYSGTAAAACGGVTAIISANPAKLFGIYPQKGTIAVGSDADIVIFDPKKEVTIRHRDMHSRSDYELYEGFQVTGWPTHTLSRGEVIVENGKVLGSSGRGKLLRRSRFTIM